MGQSITAALIVARRSGEDPLPLVCRISALVSHVERIAAMSITRNNHYVPQWYQEGFFEPGRKSLAYVDMTPDQKVLPNGRVIIQNGAWDDTPTSRAFRQKDLYSTFFGRRSTTRLSAGCSAISTAGAQKPFAHS